MRWTHHAAIALIALSFFASVVLYERLPDPMASHWGPSGEADDAMPRWAGAFVMPAVAAVMFLLLLVLPRIDPLRRNVDRFRAWYDHFILAFIAFMLYMHSLVLAWNLGASFDMNRMVAPAMGTLFILIGLLVRHAKRNWFIGIRTPWTLSSPRIWNETHRACGKLFVWAGVIALFGTVFPRYALWLVLVPVLAAASYSVWYSWWVYHLKK
ncbi:SdpI family protein [Candidatus Woesearchaeota archaeon]|nr:SdpI family protein [Candidatus Woesearchaeota archaeon]